MVAAVLGKRQSRRQIMVRIKRWCDPITPEDGIKVLVCRYRPRGVEKKDETWTIWKKDLGPSKELHTAIYGKGGAPHRLGGVHPALPRGDEEPGR
jgi:hypothetical protein